MPKRQHWADCRHTQVNGLDQRPEFKHHPVLLTNLLASSPFIQPGRFAPCAWSGATLSWAPRGASPGRSALRTPSLHPWTPSAWHPADRNQRQALWHPQGLWPLQSPQTWTTQLSEAASARLAWADQYHGPVPKQRQAPPRPFSASLWPSPVGWAPKLPPQIPCPRDPL